MAMQTLLQLLSPEELEVLRKAPSTVVSLDKPGPDRFATYHFAAINYFLTGSAYPTKRHKLGALLCGEKSVSCKALENGSFDLVSPATAAKLAETLAAVDLAAFRRKIAKADLDELREEEEVDEEYVLGECDDPVEELSADLRALRKLYDRAKAKGLGVVMFTHPKAA